MQTYVSDVFPDKAQYLQGEKINIVTEIINDENVNKNVKIKAKVCFLNTVIEEKNYFFEMALKSRKELNISIEPKKTQFKGYGIDVDLYIDDIHIQTFSSSFDVVSDYRKALRYGFLAGFGDEDSNDEEDIKIMRKLHLNLVQFYDWMYRHDNLIPPVSEFQDLLGRKLNMDVVKEKIRYCHKYNMNTMAYGAVYAANPSFYNEHRDWALYESTGKPFNLAELFFIMNISKDCPWHQHIIEQYKKAINELNFDGIHMDTYGFPKTAISEYNNERKIVYLENEFPELINDTREQLEKINKNVCLIFNNVGNWPVNSTAMARQDAIYVEVWKPYEKYFHIKQIIKEASAVSGGRPVILAAYLKPFSDEEVTEKAFESFRILTAVIASNGAYHLILGEENGILNQGYYVNYTHIQDKSFLRIIRNYYDFIVRYSNIFFDKSLKDVSMTHADGDNLEYVFENFRWSTYGEPDKVWVTIKEKPGYKYISFVNLCGNDEDYWNKGKNEPVSIHDIRVKILVESDIESVFAASPDYDMGRFQKVQYHVENGTRGKNLVIEIPELKVWSILYIKLKDVD